MTKFVTPSLIIDELMQVDSDAPVETCFVYGKISWVQHGYFDVELMCGTQSKKVRFLSSLIKYQQDSPSTALIEIPKGIVIPFELSLFVLDDNAVARRLNHVEEYNSPRVIRNVEKQPERIGNIRI